MKGRWIAEKLGVTNNTVRSLLTMQIAFAGAATSLDLSGAAGEDKRPTDGSVAERAFHFEAALLARGLRRLIKRDPPLA